MMDFQTAYGPATCPKCGKIHNAVFARNQRSVPPPVIVVACQCQIPVVSIELPYDGEASVRITRKAEGLHEVERCKRIEDALRTAVEAHAFDGSWRIKANEALKKVE